MPRRWPRSTRSPWADVRGAALLRHGLDHLETFELGMTEIGRLGVAGPRMRGTKRLRLGPGLERGVVRPDRMRSVQRVVLEFGTPQQMEFDEARHLVQMRVAREPDLLE